MSQQQPCLPVNKRQRSIPDSNNNRQAVQGFDNVQQLDATEYLRRVAEEAERLPEVFESSSRQADTAADKEKYRQISSVDFIIAGSAASAQYLVSDRTSLRLPPSSQHVPVAGSVFVDRTLADFSRLRSYLEQCALYQVGGKQTNRIPVPRMKDRAAWHMFCVGVEDAKGNPGGYFHDDEDIIDENNGDDDKSAAAAEAWRKNLPVTGYTPTVSLLMQMDQVMVRAVLAHLTHYCVMRGFSASGQRAAWIYALLARLERPIHREDSVTLYSLLKKMTALREHLKLDQHDDRLKLATLNVLITIVGIYFEQGGGYACLMEVKEMTKTKEIQE
jgi:survival of motor neuron protein-interacting protein 1